jgi:predicted amidohydrolase
MSGTIRFGGAQIPVTTDALKNTNTIKKAIDWASENCVDYLVTPEAALSGYTKEFADDPEKLSNCLEDVVKYAGSKSVGLCLGTLWFNNNKHRSTIHNQIRCYDKKGKFIGDIDKCVLTPYDVKIGVKEWETVTGVLLPYDNYVIPIGGVICADLYGHNSSQGGLCEKLWHAGAKVFIHPTNALRGKSSTDDEIESMWVESWIRRGSRQLLPFFVVDNCLDMEGNESYTGPTLTQSGVCIKGIWEVKCNRFGTEYFYYDFDLDEIAVTLDSLQNPSTYQIS